MSKRLSTEQTMQLLELYKEHECLWKYNSPEYKNKEIRLNALSSIKSIMNLNDIEDVKRKLKSIRDTYNSEKLKMNKSKKSGAGTSDVYQTRLAWYNLADSFLSYSEGRKSYNNIESESDSSNCNVSSQVTMITDVQNNCSNPSTSQLLPPKIGTSKAKKSPVKSGIKKRNKIEQPSYIKTAINKLEELKNSTIVQDEFYYYGQTIASQLRSLSNDRAHNLYIKIQKLIFDERLQDHDSVLSHELSYESNNAININEDTLSNNVISINEDTSSNNVIGLNEDTLFEDIPATSSPKAQRKNNNCSYILTEALSLTFNENDNLF